jgi:hypothetical protein
MKINSKLPKLQMGGPMPGPEGPPPGGMPPEQGPPPGGPEQAGGGQDPLMQIAQIAAQALQNQDCQAAMAVCEAFLQLIQQVAGGGGAPEQPAEPTFQRKGGKLQRKG